MLDCFQHVGPNGKHTCIVAELMGPTVSRVLSIYNEIEPRETIRPDTVLRSSVQVLEAVAAIHAAGIVHGGNGGLLLRPTLVRADSLDEYRYFTCQYRIHVQ